MTTERLHESMDEWNKKVAAAEQMIPLIGHLFRERAIETSIFGRLLNNRTVINIIKCCRFARQVDAKELDVDEVYAVLRAVSDLADDLTPCHIDLGKIAVNFQRLTSGQSLTDYVRAELAQAMSGQRADEPETDIVLYGFGRIGRLLARELIAKSGSKAAMRLRAIVVRKGSENDLLKRASLLRRDSVHGSFNGTITVDHEHNAIIANGQHIQVIYSNAPSEVDYTQYGIRDAVVVDNTGKWRDREGLSQHLACPGIKRVLLTAPGKGDLKNIVHGVNHDEITEADTIISAASCTTNAITPVLKAIADKYGIRNGHVETVHSYTNDQNLIDNFHKGDRRGRAAALNMVITETGAASAVAKALPELKGKLTGNAIRVPTPNVSMAILNLNLETPVDRDDLNEYLRLVAVHSKLQKQIDYSNSPEAVSTDFVGSRAAGIVDGLATIAAGHNSCVVYV
ncbi:MAG: glyceraldehyde-3-phosphate dehydrogenase, partial [Litorivicinaceae bacterium]